MHSNFENFFDRHIGIDHADQMRMLESLGYQDLNDFIVDVIPSQILDISQTSNSLPKGLSELEALEELNQIARLNIVNRSLIGLGYYGTIMPASIKRNILENPSWYTSYTPYQAEIAQGRLEALFNFQTLVSELTGLPVSNASLLDEATAAAEAMNLAFSAQKGIKSRKFLVDQALLPQTLAVLQTRAEPLNIILEEINPIDAEPDEDVFGVLIQLPGSDGGLWDPTLFIEKAHKVGALVVVAIDPLAQVLLAPVGDLGADIAIGSAQRFGVPMGFGGPHAAFFATKDSFKRQIPGRLVGQSVDKNGQLALRLALQTREQHIRRDKATSNICTAQVLLAVISSFYAVYHGPDGLEAIAKRILKLRHFIEIHLKELGYSVKEKIRFDTIEITCPESSQVHQLAALSGFNLRILPLGSSIENSTGFAFCIDELSNESEVKNLCEIFAKAKGKVFNNSININDLSFKKILSGIPLRSNSWLNQSVFQEYRSETELMRYMHKLAGKDFSLVHGMIPLGSCTMKLNASSELIPISWKEFSSIHPLAPTDQSRGYSQLIKDLQNWISYLTGFKGASLQPNAGSQGEYAGLLVIRAWHKSRGQESREICLIPTSAHGTNPASAVMSGYKVVPVACDQQGNIDLEDLQEKVIHYSSELAVLMVTYPSTHGVFEPKIREICNLVHKYGGQVYLDGANLNAQVGLCKPGEYGADVCHLNLHKTFCIPHGGGGPGVGPIAVAEHLIPFLPGHPFVDCERNTAIGAISAAPFGSAGILPISWMYIRMMGLKGLQKASSIAILSANYLAKRLEAYYPILFRGPNGNVAHECILDLRPIKNKTGIEVDDIAKRLMDYGFHAPTVSWPVAGTLMVEPTESESFSELNRFCDAMIAIRYEIEAIELGKSDRNNNVLRLSPHTLETVTSEQWDRPYSRKQAAFPLEGQAQNKFWPAVSRIDNAFGDRNLICSCSPMEDFVEN
ncbi:MULTISPECIES: aminomethyl-transferring glycine dehydrogenase [Prochlorococcus]|uniref:aminomethyl-transferring glycine dehydrogenase n=1 Tax=Prochlorococcus TaxID=1218 RepID=UPI00056C5378|nr:MULTISPECIES: aminomethyl-transferring glycine dehydrogenase [Prochlorococcus]